MSAQVAELEVFSEDKGGAVVPKLDCPHTFSNYNKPIVDGRLNSLPAGLLCECKQCSSTHENWMCLACGEVSCSRYVEGHSEAHWLEHMCNSTAASASDTASPASTDSDHSSEEPPSHCLCLSFSDLNVWCYSCGAYIKDPNIIDTLRTAETIKFGPNNNKNVKCEAITEEPEENTAEEADDRDDDGVTSAAPVGTQHVRNEIVGKTAGGASDCTIYMAAHHKMAIYWHPDCALHNIPGHVEQPGRVTAIVNALKTRFEGVIPFRESSLATDNHALLYHTERLVSRFKGICSKAEKQKNIQHIDGDTQVMNATRNAVYRGLGCMIDAVDHLFLGDHEELKIHTAFAVSRPPGHHAERDTSMGFCFYNNAAIGAKYAQSKYGVKRAAVIDWDVHHGNGTEEGFTPDPTLFYGSTHEKDNYPGTGKDHFPFIGDKAKKEIHRRIVNRTLDRGPRSVAQFHEKWLHILDEMVLFRPDLVIISAGFDAHDEDPLSDIELLEEDFKWATEAVFKACYRIDPSKPPPVLSVLEGGYDLAAIAASAVVHCEVLLQPPTGTPPSTASSTTSVEKTDAPPDLDPSKAGYGGDEVAALVAYLKESGISDSGGH